jgi:hypothetical protein
MPMSLQGKQKAYGKLGQTAPHYVIMSVCCHKPKPFPLKWISHYIRRVNSIARASGLASGTELRSYPEGGARFESRPGIDAP